MRRLLAALAALLCLGAVPASATVPYNSPFEAGVLDAINDHRTRQLRPGPCIDRFAEEWARHLAATGRFYHSDLSDPLRRCRVRKVGEIIAYGYPGPRATVDQGWMRSLYHRYQIETESYRRAGVAAIKTPDRGWLVVVNFRR